MFITRLIYSLKGWVAINNVVYLNKKRALLNALFLMIIGDLFVYVSVLYRFFIHPFFTVIILFNRIHFITRICIIHNSIFNNIFYCIGVTDIVQRIFVQN